MKTDRLPVLRAAARWLAAFAVLLLVVGIVVAYIHRDAVSTDAPGVVATLALILAGDAVVAASLGLMTWAESRPGSLTVPERFTGQVVAYAGLPAPSWWAPAAAAGLTTLLSGLWVDTYLAGLGAGLLAMSLLAGIAETARAALRRRARAVTDPAPLDRAVVRAARRVRHFARDHAVDGDPAVEAVVEHLGRSGGRIVLVGRDGRLGDLVVPDVPRALLACEVAGVDPAEEFSRDVSGRMRNTRYEWDRMGNHSPRGGPNAAQRVVEGGGDEPGTAEAEEKLPVGS